MISRCKKILTSSWFLTLYALGALGWIIAFLGLVCLGLGLLDRKVGYWGTWLDLTRPHPLPSVCNVDSVWTVLMCEMIGIVDLVVTIFLFGIFFTVLWIVGWGIVSLSRAFQRWIQKETYLHQRLTFTDLEKE